jgi:molecular chaperone GrpE
MTDERSPTDGGSERVAELEALVAELEPRLAVAEAKRDEYLDDLQRLAADFENYRKRTARDQESLIERAHEGLVKQLLPVLDDLERALEAATAHEEIDDAPTGPSSQLEEGVRLVERQLRAILAKEGLVEVETEGSFDPHLHEALLTQPSEAEEGAILQVLQKGYRLGDRVVRPARVVISQGLQEAQTAE